MVIPTEIILNGCIIRVKLVKHLYRDYTRYGEYSSTEMIINVDADMSDQKQELIFCHELIEAIKDIYLLEDLKHDTIQPLAVALYELIKKRKFAFIGDVEEVEAIDV